MKIQILKRTKKAGGHKIYKFLLFYITLLISQSLYSSQIYDYQTENFIKKINLQIQSVNEYNKKIQFKIVNDKFPNAFVVEGNILYLSSGLLVHSPDYVSLLAVLAHEIGHIEQYHISKRKNEINNLKKINNFGNIAAIAGSMIMQQPELLNSIIVNKAAMNNLYLNFSQEQEKEADLYAVETLNNLNLSTNSIKKFLILLENKTNFELIDDELKKFSTHPLFKERYEIIDYNKTINDSDFNESYEKEFGFIKAKFMAYTNNGLYNDLNLDEKTYYDCIKYSINGNLLLSLKKLNILLSKYNQYSFLYETKADILLSYGYNNEALEFYQKVLIEQPENNYAKFNILIYSDLDEKDKKNLRKIFLDYQNLFKLFPNNKTLITKYYNLSKKLEYKNWSAFFKILLFKKKNFDSVLKELLKVTTDSNLKKIIKLYI